MTIISEHTVPVTIPIPSWSTLDASNHIMSARTWEFLGLDKGLTLTANSVANLMAAQTEGTVNALGAYARLTCHVADLIAMLAIALDVPIAGES